ncbi:esterase/lipase family protein [Bacillus paranthracis]|uniref:esterase/lipase family protein n=1 Tax=Bacillus paranthracis TaxID=2026186 RepID=UPI000D6C9DC8|nr:alpha/beta fold hydrolase [Bacillus paranthracis]PWN73297.1 hypothetical protein CV741_16985 [Bacillus cereus]PWN79068.1 hypothetical protein CV717_01205 [Bacillus cereus]UHJ49678.1 alpha/beta hydrolase [Bacillus paranthracis]
MPEDFIHNNQNIITIDTTSSQIAQFREKKVLLEGKVTIERVETSNEIISSMHHSENKLLLKVEIDRPIVDMDISFRLVCNNDNEYFFAIQEFYLQLLEDKNVNHLELVNKLSPRIELLEHSEDGDVNKAMLSKRNLNYLLSQSIEDRVKFQKYIETKELNHLKLKYLLTSETDKSINRRFYIVLNRFKDRCARNESHGTGLLEFKGDDKESRFSKVKELSELESGVSKKPIALIVHGLASRIGKAYNNLGNYLTLKGYKVYGFDYFTVNERITDNGYLLANQIDNLRKISSDSEMLVVAHSMGGLVSRSAYIEHGARIDKLIMAGTPNSGSLLVSAPMVARICFIVGGMLKKVPIKFSDLRHLVWTKRLQGFEDLSNKNNYITDLNSEDVLHYEKKYFALAGKFLGLPGDIIVHSENMISINGISMPHVSNSWNHFTYFKGNNLDNSVGRGIQYLK